MRGRWLANELVRHAVTTACYLAAAIGIFALLVAQPDGPDRSLAALLAAFAAFGVYGLVYLVLTRLAFRGSRGRELRSLLLRTHPPRSALVRWLLLTGPNSWALSVSFVSIAAVVLVAATGTIGGGSFALLCCILCIAGSWVMLFAAFAVEYARAWARGDAVRFADGDGRREFDDFLYLAVQTSTTFGSGDVAILDVRTRRLITVHSATAFLFSTVIVALFASLVLSGISA